MNSIMICKLQLVLHSTRSIIKKTPSWQQILCITCRGNLENSLSKSMYLSQMVNELGCSPYSTHRQVLGLGVNILVNIAVYPAILSCSRS